MLLQANTLGEVCAGIGTVSLAAEVLRDNVYAELKQCVRLTPCFAIAGPSAIAAVGRLNAPGRCPNFQTCSCCVNACSVLPGLQALAGA